MYGTNTIKESDMELRIRDYLLNNYEFTRFSINRVTREELHRDVLSVFIQEKKIVSFRKVVHYIRKILAEQGCVWYLTKIKGVKTFVYCGLKRKE